MITPIEYSIIMNISPLIQLEFEVYLKTKIAEKKNKKIANNHIAFSKFGVTDFIPCNGFGYDLRAAYSPVAAVAAPSLGTTKYNNIANGSRSSVYFTPIESADQILQSSPIHINYINDHYDDTPLKLNIFTSIPDQYRTDEYLYQEPSTSETELCTMRSATATDNITTDGITDDSTSTAMIGNSSSSNEDNCCEDWNFESPSKIYKKNEFCSMHNVYDINPKQPQNYYLKEENHTNPSATISMEYISTDTQNQIEASKPLITDENTEQNFFSNSDDHFIPKNSSSLAMVHKSCYVYPAIDSSNDSARLHPSSSLPEFLLEEDQIH